MERKQPKLVETDDITRKAMALHTSVYRDRGFIGEGDIIDGYFRDQYTDRSRYFFQENERREVGARLISATRKQGIMSLPTMKNFRVDPDVIASTAGVSRISDLSYKKVVEVSGLASEYKGDSIVHLGVDESFDPVRLLYANLLRHSLEQGHELWSLNIDRLLLRDMRSKLGHDQVITVGEKQSYMGPPTVPAVINPQRVVQSILDGENRENQAYLKQALDGLDGRNLSEELKTCLDNQDITYTKYSRNHRILKDPRTLAYSVIVGYSAARALPVTGVEEFHGSIPLLWAIDVGTAIPYTWGMIETFSSNSTLSKKIGRVASKSIGATVASASFIAPYAYFYSQGEEYPTYVNAVVAGLVGVAGMSEYIRHRRERNLRGQLMGETGIS